MFQVGIKVVFGQQLKRYDMALSLKPSNENQPLAGCVIVSINRSKIKYKPNVRWLNLHKLFNLNI